MTDHAISAPPVCALRPTRAAAAALALLLVHSVAVCTTVYPLRGRVLMMLSPAPEDILAKVVS